MLTNCINSFPCSLQISSRRPEYVDFFYIHTRTSIRTRQTDGRTDGHATHNSRPLSEKKNQPPTRLLLLQQLHAVRRQQQQQQQQHGPAVQAMPPAPLAPSSSSFMGAAVTLLNQLGLFFSVAQTHTLTSSRGKQQQQQYVC